MATLTLRGVPYWLATLDTRRMEKDNPRRLEILQYQREVVDVLYEWASTRKPQTLVPAEPIDRPAVPGPGATPEMWLEYHQQMVAFLEWQRDMQSWQGSIESRVEGIEALIPDILDRLPPATISSAHQQQVKALMKQLTDRQRNTQRRSPPIYTRPSVCRAIRTCRKASGSRLRNGLQDRSTRPGRGSRNRHWLCSGQRE